MIDFHAGETQFVDHLAPIYLALPPEMRGEFITQHGIRGQVAKWGIGPVRNIDPSRPVVVASYGDQKRARRMGRTRIARAEHGAGQSYLADPKFGNNSSYAGGKDCWDIGLFLCPNDYSGDRWQAAYPGARVEVVGCPKLDHLPARVPGDGPVVAVSFHFDIPIIPETRWAWPTYRNALPALAERYKVIGHGHPKGLGLFQRYLMRMGIEVVPDFEDVCRRADLYVMDNSSTLFEFASTGRPVVVLNDPQYRRGISHGGRFWDWADVGVQVNGPAELLPAVERGLLDAESQQEAREAALRLAYAYRTGAAQRAADALVDWASERRKVAA